MHRRSYLRQHRTSGRASATTSSSRTPPDAEGNMADPKMSVVVHTRGHLVGAFTRTGDPTATPDIKRIVGDALPLRNPQQYEQSIAIAPDALQLKTVARQ